jgi:hypothetical protein
MSTDLRAIMDRDERRRRMLNDPDLFGNALLFALALDEVLANRKDTRRHLGDWLAEVAELAWGVDTGRYLVERVVGDDVPRFEPAREAGRVACVAPMIRREGLCGKPSTWSAVDRSPETGEARWVGLCGRHRDLEAKFDVRRKAWIANGQPSPPPNTGGVLKRYFKGWRTPMSGDPGFPDLVLARDGVVIVAELKSRRGQPTDDQKMWLEALGAHARLWRPQDWPAIEQELRRRR